MSELQASGAATACRSAATVGCTATSSTSYSPGHGAAASHGSHADRAARLRRSAAPANAGDARKQNLTQRSEGAQSGRGGKEERDKTKTEDAESKKKELGSILSALVDTAQNETRIGTTGEIPF